MTNSPPTATVSYGQTILIRELVPDEIDSKLRGSRLFKRSTQGWDDTRMILGLKFDLSKCKKVTLSGAAQLLVIVKHAVDCGYAIGIDRPRLGVLESELHAFERQLESGMNLEWHLVSTLSGRYEASRFLDAIGFDDALGQIAATLTLSDGHEQLVPYGSLPERLKLLYASLDSEATDEGEGRDPELLVPSAFKLRWITALERNSIKQLLSELVDVMSQGEASLLREDAESFANTVLFEALDNVRMHSLDEEHGSAVPMALIGAAFVRNQPNSDGDSQKTWLESGFSLDVVLADAGDGIVARLGPHFVPRLHNRFLPESTRNWPLAARTVVWAFHPLSTSRTPLEEDALAARGLSRASQQVRYHGGTIRIRTDAEEVKWGFGVPGQEGRYAMRHLALVPGSVLDVSIPYRHGSTTPLAPIEPEGGHPTVVSILLREVSRAAQILAAAIAENPDAAGVIVYLPDSVVRLDGGRACAQLVGTLSAVSHGTPTIVKFGTASSADLFSSFEALSQRATAVADSDHLYEVDSVSVPEDPILLIGSDRKSIWWGGPPESSPSMLQIAKDARFRPATGPLDVEEDRLETLTAPHHAARRAGWIKIGTIDQPTINASDVRSAQLEWLNERLSRHIASNGLGVSSLDTLLPNREAVGRFIDLRRVLDSTGTTRLAGQLMAELGQGLIQDEVALVAVLPDVPEQYVSAYCESLDYRGRVVRMDPSVLGWRLAPAPDFGRGKSLVLAGVRHRGETLRTICEQLFRWGVNPQLISVALDAADIFGTPISALHVDVPVISLQKVDIPPSTTPADTLAAALVKNEKRDDTYLISQRDFAKSLALHGVGFQLVHIERSEERHLVGYFDIPEALQTREIRDVIDGEFVKAIEKAIPSGTHLHHLAYPSDDRRAAGPIVERLAIHFPNASVLPVDRDSHSELAEEPELTGPVTFVDWGVVTARTAREVLYRLVARGASPVNFLAVTSQLDDIADRDLRAVAALHHIGPTRSSTYQRELMTAESPKASPPLTADQGDPIPVAFRCLTRITPIAYSRSACPICLALIELGMFARNAPVALLRDLAVEKQSFLQPRPRDEALLHVRDLYQANLTRVERSKIIDLWDEMHAALKSEGFGYILFDRLSNSTGEDRLQLSIALCRIVAARHDLLQSPPFIYLQFREIIADLALALIVQPVTDESATVLSSPVRRQAVVTLRASSKDRFIDAVPFAIRSNLHSRHVVSELLLGIYSLLEKPYFHGSALMSHLHAQLQDCEQQLTGDELDGRVDDDIVLTVRVLKRRASTRLGRAEHSATQIGAWRALKSEYGPQLALHHHSINKLNQISRSLDDYATTEAVDSGDSASRLTALEDILRLWQDCADFLAGGVLPYLPRLAEVLSSNYYRDKVVVPEDWDQWIRLLSSDSMEQDLLLPRKLDELIDEPRDFDDYARVELLSQSEWLQRFFLAIKRDERGGRSPIQRQTLLSRWLEECPSPVGHFTTHLIEALDRVQSTHLVSRISDAESLDPVLIFCPHGLLDEAANVVGSNFEDHCSEFESIQMSITISRMEDVVEFEIRSHGTAPEGFIKRKEGGLYGLKNRMAPFLADIDWYAELGDFVTKITCLTWEESYG